MGGVPTETMEEYAKKEPEAPKDTAPEDVGEAMKDEELPDMPETENYN